MKIGDLVNHVNYGAGEVVGFIDTPDDKPTTTVRVKFFNKLDDRVPGKKFDKDKHTLTVGISALWRGV